MRRREEVMNTEEYIQYRETKVHEQPGFAYNTYLCTIPLDFPKVALHWHDEMELIYIKKGSGEITLDLNAYEVCSGSIAVVPPGCLHSISSEEHMEYENIIFSVSLLETSGDDWCSRAFFSPLKEGRLFLPRMLEPGDGTAAQGLCFSRCGRPCLRSEEGRLSSGSQRRAFSFPFGTVRMPFRIETGKGREEFRENETYPGVDTGALR
jgi:mannose-6-phosphate isomerase-like protein (cupin superfamily)